MQTNVVCDTKEEEIPLGPQKAGVQLPAEWRTNFRKDKISKIKKYDYSEKKAQ
jgi:hypothetical protein